MRTLAVSDVKPRLLDNTLEVKPDDTLYVSHRSWGDPRFATFDQWYEEIPDYDREAKRTEYYDWYRSAPAESEPWDLYRMDLLAQLEKVKVVADEANQRMQ